MTEQNERDESSQSQASSKVWDREEVFPTAGASAPLGNNDLQGLLDLTKAQLSRTVQEFEAFRKRAKEERIKTILFCNEALVLDLLPILDDLDRSLEHLSSLPGDVGEGLRLVLQHFHKVLEKRNILTIDPEGRAFDPLRHEAVQVCEKPGVGPGTVVKTIDKGYLCSGRLLRPARVAITPVAKPEPVAPVAAAARPHEPAVAESSLAVLVPELMEEETAPHLPVPKPAQEIKVEASVEPTPPVSETPAEPVPEPKPTQEPTDSKYSPEEIEFVVSMAEESKAVPKGRSASDGSQPKDPGTTKSSKEGDVSGNPSERSWVIDDDALADLEGALGESISFPEPDSKTRSLS